jgi:hypothetical protein
VIREYSTMRLHGRNFQFAHPLSAERIEAIGNGDIDPISAEQLKAAYEGAIDDEVWLDRFHAAAKPLSSRTISR